MIRSISTRDKLQGSLTYVRWEEICLGMRITVNLPDDLVLQAKKAALEADTTLVEIIANALREALLKGRRKQPRRKIKLTTYGEGGTFPGVNLDDTSAVLDLMDGLDGPERH